MMSQSLSAEIILIDPSHCLQSEELKRKLNPKYTQNILIKTSAESTNSFALRISTDNDAGGTVKRNAVFHQVECEQATDLTMLLVNSIFEELELANIQEPTQLVSGSNKAQQYQHQLMASFGIGIHTNMDEAPNWHGILSAAYKLQSLHWGLGGRANYLYFAPPNIGDAHIQYQSLSFDVVLNYQRGHLTFELFPTLGIDIANSEDNNNIGRQIGPLAGFGLRTSYLLVNKLSIFLESRSHVLHPIYSLNAGEIQYRHPPLKLCSGLSYRF